jgi:hypothetical protein
MSNTGIIVLAAGSSSAGGTQTADDVQNKTFAAYYR